MMSSAVSKALLRVDADLRAGARERIDDADHHFRGLRARRERHQRGSGGGSEQNVAASDRHWQSPLLLNSAVSNEAIDELR